MPFDRQLTWALASRGIYGRPVDTATDPDPFALARQAAAVFAERSGVTHHDVAVVIGSGWSTAADLLGTTRTEVDYIDLPGFSPPAAAGHTGTVRSVVCGGSNAMVFLGRTHLYEGHGVAAVVHPVRTAAAAGCRVVVLTNGCGGLRPEWAPGTPVLITDHLNLTATSPLVGATFVDLTDLYSSRLRAICKGARPDLAEGVYAQFRGPHYETPAEVAMVGVVGGHLVGMSTALEAIAAREVGMEVLAISLVTNPAAGVTGEPLDHREVLAAGEAAAGSMGGLLADVLPRLVAA